MVHGLDPLDAHHVLPLVDRGIIKGEVNHGWVGPCARAGASIAGATTGTTGGGATAPLSTSTAGFASGSCRGCSSPGYAASYPASGGTSTATSSTSARPTSWADASAPGASTEAWAVDVDLGSAPLVLGAAASNGPDPCAAGLEPAAS
jgi:hypothetical protein